MKTEFIKSTSRGHIHHLWFDSFHTFSFADYYDPERIYFGTLQVLNDETVIGGQGFGTHSHENMEIITFPLYGSLAHYDSMGNKDVLSAEDVQVISAGTGIFHSEINASKEDLLKFLQIWILPDKEDVQPRYEQKRFDFFGKENHNRLIQIVSPDPEDEGLWIHQKAWLYTGVFDKDIGFEYEVKRIRHGVFFMVIEGSFSVQGRNLQRRDGMGVWHTEKIMVETLDENSRILIIDIPMV
ncbi:MAG: pirin family protein [Candidatus Azobacteroides sp.]|nr:pirin family protein [Candidatus Azobacteroides sp.]